MPSKYDELLQVVEHLKRTAPEVTSLGNWKVMTPNPDPANSRTFDLVIGLRNFLNSEATTGQKHLRMLIPCQFEDQVGLASQTNQVTPMREADFRGAVSTVHALLHMHV